MLNFRDATFTTDDELDAPDAQSTVVAEPEPEIAEPEIAEPETISPTVVTAVSSEKEEPVEKSYSSNNTSSGTVSKQVFSSHSRIEEDVSCPSDYENDEEIRTTKIYVYKVTL